MTDTLAWWTNVSTMVGIWGGAILSAYRYRRSLRAAISACLHRTGLVIAAYFQKILRFVVVPVCASCRSLWRSLAKAPKGMTLAELLMVVSVVLTNDHGIEA